MHRNENDDFQVEKKQLLYQEGFYFTPVEGASAVNSPEIKQAHK